MGPLTFVQRLTVVQRFRSYGSAICMLDSSRRQLGIDRRLCGDLFVKVGTRHRPSSAAGLRSQNSCRRFTVPFVSRTLTNEGMAKMTVALVKYKDIATITIAI